MGVFLSISNGKSCCGGAKQTWTVDRKQSINVAHIEMTRQVIKIIKANQMYSSVCSHMRVINSLGLTM